MRTTIVVSVVVHALIFLGFKDAFSSLLAAHSRLYEVELIRPPVDGLEEGKDATGDEAAVKEEEAPPRESPPEELLEDTISLDTKDRKYVSYATLVKGRINENWQYPRQAEEYLLEGKLLLVFTLSKNGAVNRIKVLDTSGHEILDKEACRAVQAAAPFPAFPGHLRVQKLHIRASFDYKLTSR